eukprot:m.121533 g.121533  ORF g.121533 m.121533 type:complete len:419 (+) comp9608_c0_seq1:973-2229(+)
MNSALARRCSFALSRCLFVVLFGVEGACVHFFGLMSSAICVVCNDSGACHTCRSCGCSIHNHVRGCSQFFETEFDIEHECLGCLSASATPNTSANALYPAPAASRTTPTPTTVLCRPASESAAAAKTPQQTSARVKRLRRLPATMVGFHVGSDEQAVNRPLSRELRDFAGVSDADIPELPAPQQQTHPRVSPVFACFDVLHEDSAQPTATGSRRSAKCKLCNQTLVFITTTQLWSHMSSRHANISARLRNRSVGESQAIVDNILSTARSQADGIQRFFRPRSEDQIRETFHLLLGALSSGASLSALRNPWFAEIITFPSYAQLNRSVIPALFYYAVTQIRAEIELVDAVAISADGWTQYGQQYIGIMLHWMDAEFEMRHRAIDLVAINESETAEFLEQLLHRRAGLFVRGNFDSHDDL